ncbi:MAG: branched-chain amino acid ABC transporter permease [Hyphomicrobiales bacterium]|nr:MAG: branched-chain amino acid ABC transporter permease [Hyphomicrobiales bacterium]
MDLEIALLLGIDGIATGAIYALIALGTVLIFSVTRVIFVPFGDLAAIAALSLAMMQIGRLPGAVWMVAALAAGATLIEVGTLLARREYSNIPKAIALYGLLPLVPVAIAVATAGMKLPMLAQMALTLALVTPLGPLIERIVFRPLANASVLVLLIVSVAVHFALSGLALLAFGPEGFRTQSLSDANFDVFGILISAQAILIVVAAIALGGLLYLYFEHTIGGKALRASAINRTGARIVGIRPAQTSAAAYTLGSILGGISGLLIGPMATLYYDSGFLIGLKAFVGAIIGGLASYPLTALGAVLIGILESFASFWSSTLKETIVFSALIPILVWRSLMAGTHESEEEEEEIA